jgi:hypothetical protein
MTDQTQVIPAARRLLRLGAFYGAAQVLFNAALQREAADRCDLSQWTPAGAVPLRTRQPTEHFNPANDHVEASNLTA